ncbi:MAG: DUF1801 domain-containing protein [Betaproteobacteria bacterium]
MRAMPTKPDFPNVGAHVGAQDLANRERFAHWRGAVRATAPVAVEGIRYPMPAHAHDSDSAFVAFAARKRYISLYVGRPEILQAFAADVGHPNAGKACLRFGPKVDRPLAALARRLNAIAAASRRGDLTSC